MPSVTTGGWLWGFEMPLADRLARVNASVIDRHGDVVTRTRRGVSGSVSYRALAQPLNDAASAHLRAEGEFNLSDADAHVFVLDADADVAAVTDTLQWRGWEWRVVRVQPRTHRDVLISQMATCVRSEAVS